MNNCSTNFFHDVSVVTYNCHGVNQGLLFLESICSTNTSVIMLQETWLNSDEMIRTFNNLSSNYQIFVSSPMDERQASSVLRGRPYGGMVILIHNLFAKCFSNILCAVSDPNFIILKLDMFA